MQASPKGTTPLLALAAKSIAAVTGVEATMVDVVHGKAFRHYSEALRQYLAIRLASVEEATEALGELRTMAAALDAEELAKSPGVRGRLYRMAREITERRLAGRSPPDGAAKVQLPWQALAGSETAIELERIREKLSDKESELLELRHARGLTKDEMAFVLGFSPDEVTQKIEAAMVQARFAMGRPGDSPEQVGSALLSAFALEPSRSSLLLDEREPLPAGTVIGNRYEIGERVGSGAFADVYRARDTEVPGHIVALKLLHQSSASEAARENAMRELHLIASVFHPSIVQFKDNGWHEGRLWFVMPWYAGESLEDRMEREPLSRAEARKIFEPLARALASMHAAGIRHQDVKPDNILLARLRSSEGAAEEVLPVLLDLGVAAKEAEMVVAGTPTYFPPEVAAQFASIDIRHAVTHRADVFSLALSLRNALEPSTREDVSAGAVEAFIERRARNLPAMPEARDLRYLHAYLSRWMSLEPESRPDAERLAAELSVLTRPEERRERRNKLLRWLVPTALAIGLTFGFVVVTLSKQALEQRMEAARARSEADVALTDLGEESARRQALEEDVAQIRERYQSSNLSRQELTEHLATTTGELNALKHQFSQERTRSRVLRERLTKAEQAGERLTASLGQTQSQLAAERERTAQLNQRITDLRTELNEARGQAEVLSQQVAELGGTVSTLRGQLAAEQARSQVLDQRLTEAEAARARAQAELAQAQRRIAQLERQLSRARPLPLPDEPGGGQPPPPEPTPPGG